MSVRTSLEEIKTHSAVLAQLVANLEHEVDLLGASGAEVAADAAEPAPEPPVEPEPAPAPAEPEAEV